MACAILSVQNSTSETKKPCQGQGFTCDLERAMGIEPTALAWEARVLPLYDARAGRLCTRRSVGTEALSDWAAKIQIMAVSAEVSER